MFLFIVFTVFTPSILPTTSSLLCILCGSKMPTGKPYIDQSPSLKVFKLYSLLRNSFITNCAVGYMFFGVN